MAALLTSRSLAVFCIFLFCYSPFLSPVASFLPRSRTILTKSHLQQCPNNNRLTGFKRVVQQQKAKKSPNQPFIYYATPSEDQNEAADNASQATAVSHPKRPNYRSWEESFEALKQYKQKYGDCNVPEKYPEDPKLRVWLRNQRQTYHLLSKAKKEKLDGIGLVSHLKKHRTWEESFEALKQYKQKYGDCNVPDKYPEDPRLGWWVSAQRQKYHRLSKAKQDKLDGIGFSAKLQRTWEENYELLKQYKEVHGDCNVPTKYPKDPTLRRFVQEQRVRRNSLSQLQHDKLKELGFIFVDAHIVQYNERWENMFKMLQDYKKKYGDCLVPQLQDEPLSCWVATQRRQKKKGLLSRERQSKLDSIDFVWQLKQYYVQDTSKANKKWHQQYEKLIAFKEKHNHTMVPQTFEEDKFLGSWVHRQKALCKKGLLRHDRKELLDNIDFTWTSEQELGNAWNKRYEELKEFYDTHQSSLVGLSRQNKRLYDWLYCQRIYNARGTLHPKRKAKLDKIKGWFPAKDS